MYYYNDSYIYFQALIFNIIKIKYETMQFLRIKLIFFMKTYHQIHSN